MKSRRTITFQDASLEFVDFLRSQGIDRQPIWVDHLNAVKFRGTVFVRVSEQDKAVTSAEFTFQRAMKEDLGVQLYAFADLIGRPVCTVEIPQSRREAEELMFSNRFVKYSARTPLMNARPVSNSMCWLLLRLLGRVRFPGDRLNS